MASDPQRSASSDEHIDLKLSVVQDVYQKGWLRNNEYVSSLVFSPFSRGHTEFTKPEPKRAQDGTCLNEDVEEGDSALSAAETLDSSIIPVESKSFSPWTSILDVKKFAEDQTGVHHEHLHAFFKSSEVPNHRLLNDLDMHSGSVVTLIEMRPSETKSGFLRDTLHGLSFIDSVHVKGGIQELRGLITDVNKGFRKGLVPKLADDGLGGTYFLRDAKGRNVALFKPADEEPMAANNPRGLAGRTGGPGMRDGVRSGETFRKEAAAFLLDKDGIAGVPPTCLAEGQHSSFCGQHSKQGVFQKFVKFDDMACDLSSSLFPTEEVHKIGILDLRLNNADRNDGNILVQRRRGGSTRSPKGDFGGDCHDSFFEEPLSNAIIACSPPVHEDTLDTLFRAHSKPTSEESINLVPIDHGLCLPTVLGICWFDITWVEWKQAKEPFSRAMLSYIESLDPDTDGALLENVIGISRKAIRLMKCSTMLLQEAARRGFTLFDISKVAYRDDDTEPSALERIIDNAEALALQQCATLTSVSPKGTDDLSVVSRQYSVPDFGILKKISRVSHTTHSGSAGELFESQAKTISLENDRESTLEKGSFFHHFRLLLRAKLERRRHSA